jgi:hypothetical protein
MIHQTKIAFMELPIPKAILSSFEEDDDRGSEIAKSIILICIALAIGIFIGSHGNILP